jgi:hypothetical protein
MLLETQGPRRRGAPAPMALSPGHRSGHMCSQSARFYWLLAAGCWLTPPLPSPSGLHTTQQPVVLAVPHRVLNSQQPITHNTPNTHHTAIPAAALPRRSEVQQLSEEVVGGRYRYR